MQKIPISYFIGRLDRSDSRPEKCAVC